MTPPAETPASKSDGTPPAISRLRKRREFLATAAVARKGVTRSIVLQAARRDDNDLRIGFTVTKKLGNAVVRNRIRRRLRAAARDVFTGKPHGAGPGKHGYNYVLIGRYTTRTRPYGKLTADLVQALGKVHRPKKETDASTGTPKETGR